MPQAAELAITAVLALLLVAEVVDGMRVRSRLRELRAHGPVDAATGLMNGPAVEQRLEVEVRRARRLGGDVEVVRLQAAPQVDAVQFGIALQGATAPPLAAARIDDATFVLVRPQLDGADVPDLPDARALASGAVVTTHTSASDVDFSVPRLLELLAGAPGGDGT